MYEFIRVLNPNEVSVLQDLNPQNKKKPDLRFHREPRPNYQRLVRNVEEENEIRESGWYAQITRAMKGTLAFASHEMNAADLKQLVTQAIPSEYECDPDTYASDDMERVPLEILSRIAAQPDETSMRKLLREEKQPAYWRGKEKRWKKLSDETLERVVVNMQGIISIMRGQTGAYRDVFIPAHVYTQAVKPALQDQKHRFKIEVDDVHNAVLEYVYGKTTSLRKRFANRFRPEFTRPEIIRELGLPGMTLQQCRQFMTPLEGILGRIENRATFAVKLKGERPVWDARYSVYYSKPSWFLSYKHQQLIAADEIFPVEEKRKAGAIAA